MALVGVPVEQSLRGLSSGAGLALERFGVVFDMMTKVAVRKYHLGLRSQDYLLVVASLRKGLFA
jgi:hypothetical protein